MSSFMSQFVQPVHVQISVHFKYADGKPYVRFKTPKMERRTVSRQTASLTVAQVVPGSDEGLSIEGVARRRSKSAPMTLADRVKSRVRVVKTGKTSGPGQYLY